MKEKLPLGINGLIKKRLAWDEAQGNQSMVARVAYQIFQERRKEGLPGTPESDWETAEKIVEDRFAKELIRR
jgi:hypothetical protein